jgi:hypothetical protein
LQRECRASLVSSSVGESSRAGLDPERNRVSSSVTRVPRWIVADAQLRIPAQLRTRESFVLTKYLLAR